MVVNAPAISSIKMNISRNLISQFLLILNLFFVFPVSSVAAQEEILSLPQAEMMALGNDFRTKKARAQQESLKEQSVAAYSWPDPKLNLGIANLPVETFDIQQEPMTQTVFGITQAFPPWGAVGAKSNQLQDMSESMGHEARNQRLLTIVGVRKSWLDVYFQHQAKRLIQESLDMFGQFINVTKFQYRAGRGNQQDVIRAQLEQNLLQDQLAETDAQYEASVAVLAKWLGVDRIERVLDMQFPALPKLPESQLIATDLERHPTVQMRKMRVNSAENGVNYANSQLRPGWALMVQYGLRANDPSGMNRDDFLSAMLTFELPLFSGKRQDRMVAASKSDVVAAQQELDDWRREIKMRFEKSLAVYTHADERVQLYHGSVLPHSEQNTEATLKAYQSGVTDFNVLVRARLTELKSQLQFVKLNVERAKAQIELLYFAGVDN